MDYFCGKMEIALDYGVDVAIFIENVKFWSESNAKIHQNFIDGRYWVYYSLDGFSNLYPIWSRDQVKRIIAKCKNAGLLLTADYNDNPYKRTKWYSLSDKVLNIYGVTITEDGLWRERHIDRADKADDVGRNRHVEEGKTAKCTSGETAKCLKEKDKKKETKEKDTPKAPQGGRQGSRFELAEEAKPILRAYAGEDRELARALGEHIKIRVKLRAVNSVYAVRLLLSKLDELSEGRREDKLQLIRQSVANSWKSYFPLRGGPPVQPDACAPALVPSEEVSTW